MTLIEVTPVLESPYYDERRAAGSTDHARVVAAIAMADAAGGGVVLLGDSAYDFTTLAASITIPSGVQVAGLGGTITAPTGLTFPVFDIDGGSDVRMSNLVFTVSGATGTGYGVRIRGDASDVILEDLHFTGFVNGICIDGSAGTTPGTCRRLTLRTIYASNSPTNWGIGVEDCDVITLTDCHCRLNWLDGIKLRAKASNVTIIGGSGTENGQGYLADPVLYAGDGIDAYAGGDTLSISDFVADRNYGHGVQVKSGELNKDDSATYGYVRNVLIDNLHATGNLAGSGLTVGTDGTTTPPLVANVAITGGVYRENSVNGMLIGARNVVITAPLCVRNADNGIFVPSYGMDTRIVAPVCIGNGYPDAAGGQGIQIDGNGGSIIDAVVIGRDEDTIYQEADYDGTIYSNRGITFSSGASGRWNVVNPTIRHCTTNVVRVDGTGATVLVDSAGTGNPGGYGSYGSTYRRTDTTNVEDQFWVKAGNVAVNTTSGWVRRTQVPVRASLPTAVATYKGLMLLLDNAGASDDTLHICVQTGASTYAWKQVTVS